MASLAIKWIICNIRPFICLKSWRSCSTSCFKGCFLYTFCISWIKFDRVNFSNMPGNDAFGNNNLLSSVLSTFVLIAPKFCHLTKESHSACYLLTNLLHCWSSPSSFHGWFFVFCCLTLSVSLFRWLEYGCCICFFVFSLFPLSLVPSTRSYYCREIGFSVV